MFYERLVKPFPCQVGHWQVLLPVCVCGLPALPCHAMLWAGSPPSQQEQPGLGCGFLLASVTSAAVMT